MRKFNFKALLLLSCGHVAVDTFQGALPAILPFLKDNLSLSYTMAGMILIVANISSSVIQPLFGRLADRKDTYILLPLGAFLAGAGFCTLPLARNYLMVVLLAAVSGMGIAAFHPAAFKTARFFTGEKMATGMSVFSVGGNAGMALGPILALSVIHYRGFSSLWWMASLTILFVTSVLVFRRTVAVPPFAPPPAAKAATGGPKAAHRALIVIICVIILRTWTLYCVITYVPFYYINYLRGNPIFAGKLVSLFLLGGAAGTLVGSPLADRFGHRFWLRFSMLSDALLFPLVLWTHGPVLFAIITLFGLMLVSTFPITIVMGQNLFPHSTGVASGFMSGFAIGAGGIGVTLLGVVADHFGVPLAMKCIWALPVTGFVLAMMLSYPVAERVKSNLAAAGG
ncbi:MAG: MFS transporter [Deltaproteobacteria bacterium]|jgi:FSR family fosmidomycin resistance protein-like MFS transporter|nr:MFS transporter [Deltaproteobacteria bacterium]MDA8305294.1 MFS transporter [Deltaproteobacteria bacterium]